jgi:alkylhydroperoxidase family enzyme
LATLISGVAEGKGLCEFVPWEEVSESFEQADESGQCAESVVRSSSNDFNNQDPPSSTDVAHAESAHDDVSAENRSQDEVAADSLGTAGGDVQSEHDLSVGGAGDLSREDHVDRASVPLQGQDGVDLHKYKSTLERTVTATQTDDDLDEDGDLIDYEDEEYEQAHGKPVPAESTVLDEKSILQNGNPDSLPPCLKPFSCFCPKCMAHLLNEYEAINEDLRRRSISHTTEETDSQTSNHAEVGVSLDDSVAHD